MSELTGLCKQCGTCVYFDELWHNHNNTGKWVCDYCLCRYCHGIVKQKRGERICDSCGADYY